MRKIRNILGVLFIFILCIGGFPRELNNVKAKENQKAKQVITVGKEEYTKYMGDKKFSIQAKTTGNGKLKYKSSNEDVVTISKKGYVSIHSEGTSTITVKASETKTYKKASKKITIVVRESQLDIGKNEEVDLQAVLILEDGRKIVPGKEVPYSKLKNAVIEIDLGTNISATLGAMIVCYNEYTLDDLQYADWAYTDLFVIPDRMNNYDDNIQKYHRWSTNIHAEESTFKVEDFFYDSFVKEGYNNLAICLATLDNDWNRQDTILFNWTVNIDK